MGELCLLVCGREQKGGGGGGGGGADGCHVRLDKLQEL